MDDRNCVIVFHVDINVRELALSTVDDLCSMLANEDNSLILLAWLMTNMS